MAEEVIKRRGLLKKHAAVDYEVWQWKTKLEQSRATRRVTKTEVQAYAVRAYKNAGINTFKASDGWYRRWRVRWAQSDFAKLKDTKEKGDCKKIAESESKTESCGTDKNRSTSKPKQCNDDHQSSQKCSKYENHKNNLSDTFNEINKLEDETDSKKTDYDFPNELSLVQVESSIGVNKNEQFLTDKLSSSNNYFPSEIHSDIQSKNNSVHNYLKDIKYSEIETNNQINQNTNMTEKYILPDSEIHPEVEELQSKNNSVHNYLKNNKYSEIETNSQINRNTNMHEKYILPDSEIHSEVDELQSTNNFVHHYLKDIKYDLIETNNQISQKTNMPDHTEQHCHHHVFESHSEQKIGVLEKHEPLGSVEKPTTSSHNSIEDNDCCTQMLKKVSKEINIYSESLPSPSVGLETFSTTTILDQRDMDFGGDELFCDSCEDFHPRIKGLHTSCYKEQKSASFLKSVFEIKDPSTLPVTEIHKSNEDKITKKNIKELNIEDQKINKQPAALAKGKRYLVQFKSKVVNYALNHSAAQAATTFKVNRGTVSEWLDDYKRSSGIGSSKPAPVQGIIPSDESEFLFWLDSSKFNLTNELLKNKTAEWLRLSSSKCGWLRLYAHRLNGTEDSSTKKRYVAYPEAFKRVVVFHAQTHTNLAAARVFGVARKRVVQWQGMFNDARIKPETTTSSNVTDDVVDKKLFDWFISQNHPPSSKQVRSKGLELYRVAGYQSIQCGAHWYYRWRARHKLPPAKDKLHKEVPLLSWALTQLDNNQTVTHVELAQAYTTLTHSKVSRGWIIRFCRKYYKLLQSVPEPSTALPLALEQQVVNFRQTLQETVQNTGYIETDIIAMDEVPLHFLPKGISKKPLLVRRPGFDNSQASLIVSSLADGTLLPTMFVYKDQQGAPWIRSEPCMVPVGNDPGLVSEEFMIHWLTSICSKQLQGRHGLLITDCFENHTSKDVQETMASHQIRQVVIPGGCGFKLLPTTRVCQLFKRMVEDMCKVSLASQVDAPVTPPPDQIYNWSVRVHKHLAKQQQDNIKTDFKEMLFHPCTTSCS